MRTLGGGGGGGDDDAAQRRGGRCRRSGGCWRHRGDAKARRRYERGVVVCSLGRPFGAGACAPRQRRVEARVDDALRVVANDADAEPHARWRGRHSRVRA